jgi:4-aminobutyrate aminotransferase-like enzyme/Ser/Thr protein kinase RdoA (MazF antagonist)
MTNRFERQELRRPTVSEGQALRLLYQLYGLDGVRLKPLDSFRDQNYRVDGPDGPRFVFKIANSMEPFGSLDLENGALWHLAAHDPDLRVPRLVPTLAGPAMTSITAEDGQTHHVRLLTFTPGRMAAERTIYEPAFLTELGHTVGRLVRGLAGYRHEACDRFLQWDMQVASEVVGAFRRYVTDPDRQGLITHFTNLYEAMAVPRLGDLRRTIIHGDIVGWNVVTGGGGQTRTGAEWTVTHVDGSGARQIAGFIDFGDTARSYSVAELAVVAADVAMHCERVLPALMTVTAAFHAEYPLTEVEADVLFAMIGMRVCVTATSAAQQAALDPENAYVAELNEVDWPTLRALAALKPEIATAGLRLACGHPAQARAHALSGGDLAGWLAARRPAVALALDPVVLETASDDVVDLSPDSRLYDDLDWRVDGPLADAVQHAVERQEQRGLGLAFGRYGEPRLMYALAPSADEPYNVNLGLDVFCRPGQVVAAPFAGRVRATDRTLVLVEHEVDGLAFFSRWRGIVPAIGQGETVLAGATLGHVDGPNPEAILPPRVHAQLALLLDGGPGTLTDEHLPLVARPDEQAVWLALCPNPSFLFGFPPGALAHRAPSAGEIQTRRQAHLPRSQETYYGAPPRIARGWMQFLIDDGGRAYLDAINNVAHLGHCHPAVSAASDRQTRRLYTNNRFLYEPLVAYAERLTALLPDPLKVVFFCNSGSEANELAFRLARAHTGRPDILTVSGAYHGNTALTAEAGTSLLDNPDGGTPPAHIHPVAQPNLYRGPFGAERADAAERYAELAGQVIAAAADRGRSIGAFIAEALLGSPGAVLPPAGWLQRTYALARAAGAVCIADEVQVGFGRMGSHFWAFQMAGVQPDIVTLGKMIGNGYPLSAVVTTPEIADSFRRRATYFSTYGGNPVACAVGLAVLDVIEQEGLQARASEVGLHLRAGLLELARRHPLIGHINGYGMYLGVELVRDRERKTPAAAEAVRVAEWMLRRGVIVYPTGDYYNVLKLKPPLAWERRDAEFFVAQLDFVLSNM